jgi:hypothetical protein
MAATLRLWVRDPDQPDGWRLDGEPQHYGDDLVNTSVDKARRYGERWIGRDPENRRYDVERT